MKRINKASKVSGGLVAVAVVGALALGGGAAVAKAQYDASNAHKVDGKHAVGAGTGKNARAGKLVATYPGGPRKGKLPAGLIDWQHADYSSFDMTGIQRLFGTATGGSATSTGTGSYVPLPGASVSVSVPTASTLVADFTAESLCSGTGSWCSVRILLDGTQMEPASGTDYSFDTPSTSPDAWEAHAASRVLTVPAGNHTVTVEYSSLSTGNSFRLDDWSLVVTGAAS